MSQQQFQIKRVKAQPDYRLALTFADGESLTVDLRHTIAKHPALARLRDPAVFSDVARDEWNLGVVFAKDDDLSLASDNLRALAVEQAGGYSHQRIVEWMHRYGLTLDAAADALGLSRRMLAYYRSGQKPVPRTVALAILGRESQAKDQGCRLGLLRPVRARARLARRFGSTTRARVWTRGRPSVH